MGFQGVEHLKKFTNSQQSHIHLKKSNRLDTLKFDMKCWTEAYEESFFLLLEIRQIPLYNSLAMLATKINLVSFEHSLLKPFESVWTLFEYFEKLSRLNHLNNLLLLSQVSLSIDIL